MCNLVAVPYDLFDHLPLRNWVVEEPSPTRTATEVSMGTIAIVHHPRALSHKLYCFQDKMVEILFG